MTKPKKTPKLTSKTAIDSNKNPPKIAQAPRYKTEEEITKELLDIPDFLKSNWLKSKK